MSRGAPLQTAMPGWPALMTIELACAYTSLAEASFRALAKLHWVFPVDCGGLAVTRYRRSDLDHLIDKLPLRGAEIAPQATPARDPADLAMERAARRARG